MSGLHIRVMCSTMTLRTCTNTRDDAKALCNYLLLLSKDFKTKSPILPNDVSQDPQLNETTHHSHPPVSHQHLARGLIFKEEVRQGIGDLVLHLVA